MFFYEEITLVQGFANHFKIYYDYNKASIKSDIYGLWSGKYYEFISWSSQTSAVSNQKSDGIVLTLEALPGNIAVVSTAVYTFSDAIARVGAIYTSFTVGGAIIVMIYSYRLLMSNLIKILYHFRPKYTEEVA